MGYIWKALEKGYLEHARFACCNDDMFEIFVLLGQCLCCLPMPLNTGCRIGKNRSNMFPSTSRGMCAPMESQPLWRGATMTTTRIQNNQWSLEHCSILCIVPFAALCSKMCPPPPQTIHF